MDALHTFRFHALRLALDCIDTVGGADGEALERLALDAPDHPVEEERAALQHLAWTVKAQEECDLDDMRPERIHAPACALIALWAITAEMDYHQGRTWPLETRVLLLRAVKAVTGHLTDAASVAYAGGKTVAAAVAES